MVLVGEQCLGNARYRFAKIRDSHRAQLLCGTRRQRPQRPVGDPSKPARAVAIIAVNNGCPDNHGSTPTRSDSLLTAQLAAGKFTADRPVYAQRRYMNQRHIPTLARRGQSLDRVVVHLLEGLVGTFTKNTHAVNDHIDALKRLLPL